MTSVFRDTWLSVVKRLKADWLTLVAAFVTIQFATTLLAAGPIYADSVFRAGAQQTLLDAPPSDANFAVSMRLDANEYIAADTKARNDIQEAIQLLPATVRRVASSGSFTLPDRGTDTDVAVFKFFDGIEQHASLIAGNWPQTGGAPFQVAISSTTAAALDYDVGTELTVQGRLQRDYMPEIVVTGVYEIHSSDDPYWFDSPLAIDGVVEGEAVTTYGPFVTPTDMFFEEIITRPALVNWRVFPAFDLLAVDDMAALSSQIAALESNLNDDNTLSNRFDVETDLPAILGEIERSLLATRSGVYILTLQMAILAAYALVLTAGLLVDQRKIETGLLRSRGADIDQLFALAIMEGIVLTLPAILMGPWLAAVSLRLLNHVGPLTGIGITLEPVVGQTAYLFATLAGLGCVTLLAVPALLSANSAIDTRSGRDRQLSTTPMQHAGVDLGLIVIAAIGFFQLRRYGTPITSSLHGRLEIDPLLVSAPAVGMLAGAVLALRVIPRIASLADRNAGRSARLISALGAWQVGRRSTSHARSALLLVLAIGIGLFAVSFARTWEVSQADQADFQIGADVRARPRVFSEGGIQEGWLPAAYQSLEGVQGSMPFSLQSTSLPVEAGVGQVVLVDSALAPDIVAFREDLAEEPFSELMSRLSEQRPELAVLPIPGEPQRLALDVRLDFERLCDVTDPDAETCRFADGLQTSAIIPFDQPLVPAIIIRDASGSLQRIRAQPLMALGEVERVVFPLIAGRYNGESILPVYPLELVAIELSTVASPWSQRAGTGELLAISLSDHLDDDVWTPVKFEPEKWELRAGTQSSNIEAVPSMSRITEVQQDALEFRIGTGTADVARILPNRSYEYFRVPVTFRLRPAGSQALSTLPILVSERLFIDLAFEHNDLLHVSVFREEYRAEIVGVIKAFPSVPQATSALIIADWPTIAAHELRQPGVELPIPDEYWMSVDTGTSEDVSSALAEQPFSANRITVREQRFQSLRTDPVALGTLGALSLGFVAASIFGAIGFVTSATISARQRLTEFALLRALGLSPRQLTGWLLMEHGFLIGVSLILGVGLGLLLVLGILPMVTVNQTATGVFPAAVVVIPWLTILQLVTGMIAVVVLFSAMVALLLRRIGLGALLRIGED